MRRRLSNSAEIKLFKLNYDHILYLLKNYAKNLIVKNKVKLVVLIGSLAYGNYIAFSDADLIIIWDDAPANPIDRIDKFIDPKIPIDMDIRVYTSREILKMASEKRKIVGEMIRYGLVLAGDKELFNKIKEIVENIK